MHCFMMFFSTQLNYFQRKNAIITLLPHNFESQASSFENIYAVRTCCLTLKVFPYLNYWGKKKWRCQKKKSLPRIDQ